MVDGPFGDIRRDEIGHNFPDPWGEAVDRRVVGTELDRLEDIGDPGISLSILDGAEGFAECEFSEH